MGTDGFTGPDGRVPLSIGAIYASSNGTAWRKVAGQLPIEFVGVAYGNGRFVAIGDEFSPGGSTTPKAYLSVDGESWKEYPGPSASGGPEFGNGAFIAVSWASPHVFRSSDGEIWDVVPTSDYVLGWSDVDFAGGHFVASGGGSKLHVSESGLDWSDNDAGAYPIEQMLTVGDHFYAATRQTCCAGEHPELDSFGTASSPDGINWTYVNALKEPAITPIWSTGAACVALRYSNGHYPVGPELVSGNDCSNVTLRTLPFALLFRPEILVAGTFSGILTSKDGLEWTKSLWAP